MQDLTSKRLLELLEEKEMNQRELAQIIGVQEATISRYIKGHRTPHTIILSKIAEVLDTNVDYLLGKTDIRDPYPKTSFQQILSSVKKTVIENEKKSKNTSTDKVDLTNNFEKIPVSERIKISIVGIVKAGPNGLIYSEPLGEEWTDLDSINGGHYFWLKIKGDSMVNEGIFPGDLALVREQPEVNDGELAIVIINNEEGTIKRVYKSENSIVLHSANPAYPPRIFSGNEMANIRIVGKVKEIKRKY